MKVGLFFGSFNPIHMGHLIIAEYMTRYVDEVWLVLSPQSPFKDKKDLVSKTDRLQMIELALGDHPTILPSTVEFDLPTPSYTVNTLEYLKKKHEDVHFHLIMGSDNILGIHQWKSAEKILEYPMYVYPRLGYEVKKEFKYSLGDHVTFTQAPQIELSATYIRKELKNNDKRMKFMIPRSVWEYIDEKKLYLQ